MLLFIRAFRDANVGLGSDFAFFKGAHALSIAPGEAYNSGRTPEERYAKIDARLRGDREAFASRPEHRLIDPNAAN